MKHIIHAHSAAEAWVRGNYLLNESGEEFGDIIEALNVSIIISKFDFNYKFDKKFRKIFGDERIDYAASVTFVKPKKNEGFMKEYTFTPISNTWSKTYFGRMCKFGNKFNQLEKALKKLKAGQHTKSCEMIIFDPLTDGNKFVGMPCLLAIDLKPRNKKLTLTAMFRSQRLSKSGYADFMALIDLGKFLAEEAEIDLHEICILACSFHNNKYGDEAKNTKRLLNEFKNTYSTSK